jgi:hypothetical protein
MRYLIEAVAAVLFVVSTGLLFNARVRASTALFVLIGVVTLASSYVITKTILDATFDRRAHHHVAMAAPKPAAPPSTSTLDTVLQEIYVDTESALDRIVRAGTGQQTASVGSDTVVDVIVGLSLAVLGVLAQILSSLVRRAFGTAD